MTKINFANEIFEPQSCGSLYWAKENLLIVSDLHLEKGSSYLKFGTFLPPYDTQETLIKLKNACERLKPQTLLFLGDIYHDTHSEKRMDENNKAIWSKILDAHDIIWIEGNHDPNTSPHHIKNYYHYKWDYINFRHIATDTIEYEMSGHFHPAVDIKHKGQKIRRPCFIVSEEKLILPSYGAFTGGLNINDDAFKALNLTNTEIYALGSQKVFKVI